MFLHGYSQSSASWKPFLSAFSDYRAYLIDLPGHGKSTAFTEALSFRSVGEEVCALCAKLGLREVDAIGFSFGADTLFQMALIDPSLLRSFVSVSATGTWDVNDFPYLVDGFTRANVKVDELHADSAQVDAIFREFANYTVRLSDSELASIRSEVLLAIGDDDPVQTLSEILRARQHLPNSDLWIAPDASHNVHFEPTAKQFVEIARAFLGKKRA